MNIGRTFLGVALLTAAMVSANLPSLAGAPALQIALPEPDRQGGVPLMKALSERQSTREFSERDIPLQTLSSLLWAADGVNRTDSGRRTAPTAHDRREIDIYVITAGGYYLYLPNSHQIELLGETDLRASAGTQDYVAAAPLNLIYVADFSRVPDSTDEERTLYAAAATGFIAQNVYLFCASEGLGAVIRGSIDREKLGAVLKLRPEQRIILGQTVGYPR